MEGGPVSAAAFPCHGDGIPKVMDTGLGRKKKRRVPLPLPFPQALRISLHPLAPASYLLRPQGSNTSEKG